jgi:hypothetical protein
MVSSCRGAVCVQCSEDSSHVGVSVVQECDEFRVEGGVVKLLCGDWVAKIWDILAELAWKDSGISKRGVRSGIHGGAEL